MGQGQSSGLGPCRVRVAWWESGQGEFGIPISFLSLIPWFWFASQLYFWSCLPNISIIWPRLVTPFTLVTQATIICGPIFARGFCFSLLSFLRFSSAARATLLKPCFSPLIRTFQWPSTVSVQKLRFSLWSTQPLWPGPHHLPLPFLSLTGPLAGKCTHCLHCKFREITTHSLQNPYCQGSASPRVDRYWMFVK